MKKLLVAALMVGLASPAFAAIQNVKVSGDLTTTFVDRNDFDLGMVNSASATEGLKSQDVFITQARLRVDADLSDNVSAQVGLINERAWNAENSTSGTDLTNNTGNYADDTDVQLYLANLTLREFLYSPLTVTVGRQVFTYGNGFIIGNGLPNQSSGNLQYIAQDLTERTAEDGVRAVLDYKPLTIDLIYYKNNETFAGLTGNRAAEVNGQSSDVYGFNANYQLNDPMNTVVEGYMFSRIDGNADNSVLGGVGNSYMADKNNTLYVPGLRASTNPIKGLNLQGEFAFEGGRAASNTVSKNRAAYGTQFMASYALPVLEKYKPTVNAAYTFVSGDKYAGGSQNDPNVGKNGKTYSAWDPMFEGENAGTIWNTLFLMTNMNIISAGASVSPLEDVTAAFTWYDLWAADSYNSSYNSLGLLQPNNGNSFLTPNTKPGDRGLGNEFDVNLTYNYTEDVTFGVNLGWFVPGDAFQAVSNSNGRANKDNASQALVDVGVKF